MLWTVKLLRWSRMLGGTILADIALNDAGGFAFRQSGTPEGDQGLIF